EHRAIVRRNPRATAVTAAERLVLIGTSASILFVRAQYGGGCPPPLALPRARGTGHRRAGGPTAPARERSRGDRSCRQPSRIRLTRGATERARFCPSLRRLFFRARAVLAGRRAPSPPVRRPRDDAHRAVAPPVRGGAPSRPAARQRPRARAPGRSGRGLFRRSEARRAARVSARRARSGSRRLLDVVARQRRRLVFRGQAGRAQEVSASLRRSRRLSEEEGAPPLGRDHDGSADGHPRRARRSGAPSPEPRSLLRLRAVTAVGAFGPPPSGNDRARLEGDPRGRRRPAGRIHGGELLLGARERLDAREAGGVRPADATARGDDGSVAADVRSVRGLARPGPSRLAGSGGIAPSSARPEDGRGRGAPGGVLRTSRPRPGRWKAEAGVARVDESDVSHPVESPPMTRPPPTLDRFLLECEPDAAPATRELSQLLLRLGVAGKRIARELAVADIRHTRGSAGTENVQGEEQKKLDVRANDILVETFDYGGLVSFVASEEMEKPHVYREGAGGARYTLLFDPMDGSSNIDVDGTLGTIFSIRPR